MGLHWSGTVIMGLGIRLVQLIINIRTETLEYNIKEFVSDYDEALACDVLKNLKNLLAFLIKIISICLYSLFVWKNNYSFNRVVRKTI